MESLPRWLTENELAALNTFVDVLYGRYGADILSVHLFGSKARGDFDPDSDLDVLILTTYDDWKFRQEVSFVAADISLAHDLVLSPKVISLARWEFLTQAGFAFSTSVRQDGVVLAGTPV